MENSRSSPSHLGNYFVTIFMYVQSQILMVPNPKMHVDFNELEKQFQLSVNLVYTELNNN